MQLTEFLLKKFRNKEIVLIDSDNFIYEIMEIDTKTNKIIVRIKDSVLNNSPTTEIDNGIEELACNNEWNDRTLASK